VRDAIPEARDVEVLEWTSDGEFLARFWIDTPRGSCNMLIDRRRYSQPPYELTSAHLIRTGGDGWCVSVDHGPELDERFRRTLGRRLEHQPIVVPELHD